tara:strand:+ start:22129 stop:22476 length:348 start_codon:yes stop_codon:yes gene_type:complete
MNSSPEAKRAAARDRKRKQRAKAQNLGVKEVSVKLSESEREVLDNLCLVRAGKGNDPYTRDEYISTLIRRDNERLTEQLKRPCNKCNLPLTQSCGGVYKGSPDCAVSILGNPLKL